jgi:hypothetical protein
LARSVRKIAGQVGEKPEELQISGPPLAKQVENRFLVGDGATGHYGATRYRRRTSRSSCDTRASNSTPDRTTPRARAAGMELIDIAVEIPMIGTGASLNVAVAGSLVLYRLAGFL